MYYCLQVESGAEETGRGSESSLGSMEDTLACSGSLKGDARDMRKGQASQSPSRNYSEELHTGLFPTDHDGTVGRQST
jgi:hypothetical protein